MAAPGGRVSHSAMAWPAASEVSAKVGAPLEQAPLAFLGERPVTCGNRGQFGQALAVRAEAAVLLSGEGVLEAVPCSHAGDIGDSARPLRVPCGITQREFGAYCLAHSDHIFRCWSLELVGCDFQQRIAAAAVANWSEIAPLVTRRGATTLADRVHPRSLDGRAQDPCARGLEDGVERGGEVRSAIANQEPDVLEPLAEGESEVAGLLHGPVPGRMRGDAAQLASPTPCLLANAQVNYSIEYSSGTGCR
jgi:hypothetical protein